eukprot:CAMPEP_0177753418 /NCGR_PEP_ID=MMETSP0491_2-20121128/1452_1 /TAXON_ID=63592 /ORGANISM="Tetraselmis chuii, Strain PLY429" /LENGTH=139 /DNA_ID=CAMNT_0019268707 /DNA_START=565 /DNA_END=984 /DNA_ORIENTATION=-
MVRLCKRKWVVIEKGVKLPSVGEVKVGDDGVAAVEQHVLRLQVAVDEAQEVEVLEGGDDLGDVKPDVLLLQRALTVQQLVQVAALAAAEEVVDVLGGADGAVAKRQKGVVHVPQHLNVGRSKAKRLRHVLLTFSCNNTF